MDTKNTLTTMATVNTMATKTTSLANNTTATNYTVNTTATRYEKMVILMKQLKSIKIQSDQNGQDAKRWLLICKIAKLYDQAHKPFNTANNE